MPTTYLLGAGASAGFDHSNTGQRCPSASNFFSVAFSLLNSEEAAQYNNLFLFLKNYYRLTTCEIEQTGLDMQDIQTFLDLELEYSDSHEEIDFLTKAKNEFLELLCNTFNKALQGSLCPYHGSLASSLKPGDTVISFNYDLLMDKAMNRRCHYWNPETGYGFNALVTGWSAFSSFHSSSEVLLLKPHGSFNWATGKRSKRLYVLPLESAEHRPTLEQLFAEPIERMIIPPSIKKDVHGNALENIWCQAHNALKGAERIVVIGYSLPGTDFLVKRLLYRSLSSNHQLKEFELVDRNNGEPGHPLQSKYRLLLKITKRPVAFICDKKNIREYVENIVKSLNKNDMMK